MLVSAVLPGSVSIKSLRSPWYCNFEEILLESGLGVWFALWFELWFVHWLALGLELWFANRLVVELVSVLKPRLAPMLALGLALGFEFWLALGLEFWPENSLNLFWLAFTIVFTWFDDGIWEFTQP